MRRCDAMKLFRQGLSGLNLSVRSQIVLLAATLVLVSISAGATW